LEVQIPFLQAVLGEFDVVPLVVGDAETDDVAQALEHLWGGEETLVVVSTDLSHYLGYRQAQERDRATVRRILALDDALHPHEACGAIPLNGALRLARRRGLTPRLLDLRNSGDTAGGRDRVVGYASLVFDDDAALGRALLAIARNAIAQPLGRASVEQDSHPALATPGACFVTLRSEDGELRGCRGSIEPTRPLADDVYANAQASAFDDWRFAPVTAAEWDHLRIEVSLLGPLQPLHGSSEEQLLAALRPGIDGVTLRWRGHHAVLLPQVWSQLPQPASFLGALKVKAGLATSFWAPDVQLQCFGVRKFGDLDTRSVLSSEGLT
jgi:AmmeMemoRadiSam system protein A